MILKKADDTDWMMELDSGDTMYAVDGIGHSDTDLIETLISFEGAESVAGSFIEVKEAKWGWSPRFKHCSNHDSGWGCDNEGEWHRHYSTNYGNALLTSLSILRFRPSENPAFPDRVIAVPDDNETRN